ncbi:sensor histidine kinase [Paractinoplanes brasiliensis]|uniref:histidine kinase n=1 Tax=Paractinoplanes brasiliensis TaxID=52695 RepID=A0A4R6JUK0_9ACTN|nr:histidine kinase [Actinoplanes brasiliensis]TDO38335.1 signal transduction histidine kinase [Actinoplanes brasiliensis]GID26888.1 histidine kinase [Actinoplanes brasiliensis]
MTIRGRVRTGLSAVADGLFAIGLALLNPAVLGLWLVGLVLGPVPVLGPEFLGLATTVVRWRADLERRIGTRAGVPMRRPYTPRPDPAEVGDRQWLRWLLTDPATWRDAAWLLPGALVAIGLGLLVLTITGYGLAGVLLVPLWLFLGGIWFGYGLFWPTTNLAEAWLALPQGLVVVTVGLIVAPLLRTVNLRFARLFLAPTRGAELRLRVAHLTESRAGAIDAQAVELRRIERDLHDGAQARMVAVGMTIGLAERLVLRDPAAALKLLAEARATSTTALVELRHLVRGIHPPVLAERGLEGAVQALAMSLPVRTTVTSHLPSRLDTPVESALYFAVAETLANVIRHSNARTAWVTLRHTGGVLFAEVGDDGDGGADPRHGTGLQGIERRLDAFDGTMSVTSPPGGPTVVTMELPCVSSSPRT